MTRMIRTMALFALACAALAAPRRAAAAVGPDVAQKLYERVTPSLVVVKYTWESELGRQELLGAGIVVSDDGLVMIPIGVVDLRIPDEQMKDFKILIPTQEGDPDELDAEFQGRDERTSLAFVKAGGKKPEGGDKGDKSDKGDQADKGGDGDKAGQSENKPARKHEWRPLKFEAASVRVGEPVLSVGLLPEDAAFKTYFTEAAVSATLRGEVPQVLVQGGGLGAVGSPVFNAEGKAIGITSAQGMQRPFLNDTGGNMAAVNNPPKFFTPTSDILQSLQDPPLAARPVQLPWIGVPQMTGLNKDVAEVFGLTGKPAVQVGDVIPDSPAAKAGLKQGDIIVQVNGKPLERGDQPIELPMILRRQIMRMKTGDEVTLSVIRKKNAPPQELKVTLAEAPPKPNTAKRFYAEDLGLAVRGLTFYDTYARRLPGDTKGVTIAFVREQSAAHSGGLRNGDLVTQLNGQPVTDIDQFQKTYAGARKDKPKEAVVLVVRREGRDDTVRIEPPQ